MAIGQVLELRVASNSSHSNTSSKEKPIVEHYIIKVKQDLNRSRSHLIINKPIPEHYIIKVIKYYCKKGKKVSNIPKAFIITSHDKQTHIFV